MKERLHRIVFETDTPAGKAFDVILLWSILLSVSVVIIESIPEVQQKFIGVFTIVEVFFTVIFTLEFLLRIWISPKRLKYIFSFWGLVDLFSVLPTYLSLIVSGTHYLLVVRIFRLLRVFRILKLVRFSKEANSLIHSLKSSSYKISIFLLTVISVVTILGTLLYVIEGSDNGFTSIPQSIYWAIITVTTVGYGDIVPHTVLGKFISSIAMIIGYAIIAVPTGIVTVEMSKAALSNQKKCSRCKKGNERGSNYCAQCGMKLEDEEERE